MPPKKTPSKKTPSKKTPSKKRVSRKMPKQKGGNYDLEAKLVELEKRVAVLEEADDGWDLDDEQ